MYPRVPGNLAQRINKIELTDADPCFKGQRLFLEKQLGYPKKVYFDFLLEFFDYFKYFLEHCLVNRRQI